AGNETRTHIVRRGETLSAIAAAYGVTVRDLRRQNHLANADLLKPGQKLSIPAGATAFIEHRVAKGESLASIAERYKVAVADIRAANTLKNPNLIQPGQILRIPASDSAMEDAMPGKASAPAKRPADPRRTLPATVQAAIDSAPVRRGRWKYIVIHHSAMDVGSAKGMDRYHREERGMENGLAYHFVIGNGHGMREGAVFVGRRWNEQLDGGHLAIPKLNANSIGICLVGNFQNKRPSKKQLDVLEALVRALQKKTGIPDKRVTTHRLIHKKHTECPGKMFPYEEFMRRLREP
ncbi:MAG: LysM peptidoglycan-binding domain-containing protein, partial [Verrucomicrobia bacterium]